MVVRSIEYLLSAGCPAGQGDVVRNVPIILKGEGMPNERVTESWHSKQLAGRACRGQQENSMGGVLSQGRAGLAGP